ncbi:Pao retrotransposon peptidase, partial [Opisthorchis viverrini]
MVALTQLRIPRCLSSEDAVSQSYELHCFSDASERAYGAVLYLRSRNDRRRQCKYRIAPVKAVTIPSLELTAALLYARMATQVREQFSLQITATTFWTDSMIVLQTLRNTTTRFQ